MSAPIDSPTPLEIHFHQKSQLLEIAFDDGLRFQYPCEYLRVYSPAGEGLERPAHGKRKVNLDKLEARGTCALRLSFDDGHTGDYSWPLLHELACRHEDNWRAYLARLEALQLPRDSAGQGEAETVIRVLYFIQLARLAGKDEEQLALPAEVEDVKSLLAWLRRRGPDWAEALRDERVQVTVNKHFAESFTLIEPGDEVALVPRPE